MNTFKVGDWTVNPVSGRVRHGKVEHSLQPQVMQLLVFLAEHPGELISIERMIDEVWAGKPMTSGSVYNALNSLRKAFGDELSNPRYIETIPRRGYRLIAAVGPVSAAGRQPFTAVLDQARTDAVIHPDRRLNWAGATVLLAAIALLAWVLTFPDGVRSPNMPGNQSGVPLKSIAVLPFDDMSEKGDQGYFADGLSEEILNRLAQLPGLKVTGRISSFALRDSEASFGQMGELLGVAHLLEGSVRKEGERVRVTAQLINARDGYHIWSREYDRELAEVFQVQDEIAAEIAGALELSLDAGGNDLVSSLPPVFQPGLQAHDHYLRGRALIREKTKRTLMAALEELDRALELEPDYAEAHVEMAHVLRELDEYIDYFKTDADWRGAVEEARAHIDTALAKEPGMAAAHSALGRWYMTADEDDDLEKAEGEFRRAIELNPMDSQAYYDLVYVYGNTRVSWGTPIETLERAVEIDPLWAEAGRQLALRLSLLPHRSHEAEAIFSRLLELYPENPRLLHWKSYWLRNQGHLADALKAAESSVLEDPDWGFSSFTLKKIWYSLGEPDRATQVKGYHVQWSAVLDSDRPAAIDRLIRYEAQFDGGVPERLAPSVAYALLVLKRPEDALRLLTDNWNIEVPIVSGSDGYWMGPEEPFMTMAAAFKLLNQEEQFESALARQLEILDIFSEDGTYKNSWYWRVMARVHSLRGEDYPALLALERLTEQGPLDPRELMHPAYDGIRHLAEFKAIVKKRADLINRQRTLLGLEPADMVAYQAALQGDRRERSHVTY